MKSIVNIACACSKRIPGYSLENDLYLIMVKCEIITISFFAFCFYCDILFVCVCFFVFVFFCSFQLMCFSVLFNQFLGYSGTRTSTSSVAVYIFSNKSTFLQSCQDVFPFFVVECTSIKQMIKSSAQGHSAVPSVGECRNPKSYTHSGKSATIRESNHGSAVCKKHYA